MSRTQRLPAGVSTRWHGQPPEISCEEGDGDDDDDVAAAAVVVGWLAVVSADAAAPRGHLGAWRAVASLPAMAGSLGLLLVAFGWMGRGEGLVLAGWLASGAAACTRSGERIAVRVGFGFRRPSSAQWAALVLPWCSALDRAGIVRDAVDLYVAPGGDVNAYAVGRRSIAATSGALQHYRARWLGGLDLESVLVHELGHLAARAARSALISTWLALPWRLTSQAVLGLALATVGRREPIRLLGLVVGAAVVRAVVQAIIAGQVAVAVLISTLAVCAVLCPLADAAISRRSEYAADRFATQQGAGPQLATALTRLDRVRRRQSWTQVALNRQPNTGRRIAAIDRCSAKSSHE